MNDCDPTLFYGKMNREERGYLVDVLSTAQGRAVLWAIIRECGTRELSYDPTSARSTEVNEGMSLIGLSLEHAVRASGIALYRKMEDEADDRALAEASVVDLRSRGGGDEFGDGLGPDDGSDDGSDDGHDDDLF